MQGRMLGPLRPNRAVGADKDKYGTLTGQQAQKPEIPIHTQKNRNEARSKRGLELEYPLVVDDKKYFHITKDDRVVVIRGREKGKIGTVQAIIGRTHELIITGVNFVGLV
jgi:large subunit ribosomal protein L24